MIGKIKGILREINENIGLIETKGGIFFNVYLPPDLLKDHFINQQLEIYTYLQIREDIMILYGFQTQESYNLFTELLTVDSVGPKTAFNITCFASPKKIIEAIIGNQVEYLNSIPGLGKKTALKIIVELGQKFKKTDFKFDDLNISQKDKDLIETLLALGFNKKQIYPILRKVDLNLSLEERVKQALKMLK